MTMAMALAAAEVPEARKTKYLKFGDALEALAAGRRVRFCTWAGGTYVVLRAGSIFQGHGSAKGLWPWSPQTPDLLETGWVVLPEAQ